MYETIRNTFMVFDKDDIPEAMRTTMLEPSLKIFLPVFYIDNLEK